MTTVSAPNRLALPPPLRVDLVDDERAVGWIDDNTIAFRGFVDDTEAAHAAWLAYRTIARRRARTHGTRPLPIDVEPLALRRVDDGEAILTSTRRIATLLRPGVESRSRDDSFGFAIALPEPASEPEVRAMADLAYRTVRKSGVRWALWRRDAAPLAQANANAAPATDALARRDAEKRGGRERARRGRWSMPNFAPRPAPAMLHW
jgi:hypothetical protein